MSEDKLYLIEEVGLTPEEAEARLGDSDLWLVEPELRYTFESKEEAVLQWEQAVGVLYALHGVARYHGGAVEQVLRDAQLRAEEQLRRVRQRHEDASEGTAGYG